VKIQGWKQDGRSKSSVAVSVAVHVLLFAALATITFHYPIAEFFSKPVPPEAVPVRYVALKPKPAAQPPSRSAAPVRAANPLPPLNQIPAGLPSPATATTTAPVTTGSAIGTGGSTAPTSAVDQGIGFGLRPGVPDGRLATNPLQVPRAPETEGQKNERILSSIYNEYLDSARAQMAHKGRDPGDWSWGGKDGDRWGWDKDGIHIMGVSIPNAVLAALQLNMGPSGRNMNAITDARTESFIRSDIAAHSGLMTEDEFRSAVKRIRDRVDKERSERMAKQKEKKKEPPCCTQE
jgi:hypothetical protein